MAGPSQETQAAIEAAYLAKEQREAATAAHDADVAKVAEAQSREAASEQARVDASTLAAAKREELLALLAAELG